MGLAGTIDSSVYEGLKGLIQRHPVVTTVAYEPDGIRKRAIRAWIGPRRIVPPTGPEPPTIDVEWRFTGDDHSYRIHYADANTGFNCGWHRDDDHPDLGPVHFQYENPAVEERGRERARFENDVPTEILWSALERLFEDRIPDLAPE